MKLLIVDDHAVVREGLSAMLRQIEPATLVLQAGVGSEGHEGAGGVGAAEVFALEAAEFLFLFDGFGEHAAGG